MKFARGRAGAVAIALGLIAALPGAAAAARVSGTLVTYHGQPDPSRDLHFENCATQDSYLAPTHNDGSFAQEIPPGCYDLRAERGAILRHSIIVRESDIALGRVSELAPLAPARLFQLEALFPTLLTSPAPSTAYIFTRDTTVVPASAPKVPVPPSESEWLRLKKQGNAGIGAKAGTTTEPSAPASEANGAKTAGEPSPEFSQPMDLSPQKPIVPAMP